MRSRPASRRAFSSAWRQRQVERLTPPLAALLQRGPFLSASVHSISKRNHSVLTTSFVAVRHAPWRAIVSCADNSLLLDDYATNSPLHAITPQCGEICELHEVLVPARSQPRFVREIQCPNSLPERGHRRRRVQQLELRPLKERTQSGALREQVVIVTQDKFFECRRSQVVERTAVLEALPSYADGCVDADEEEEGPSEQCVDYFVVPYVGCDPAFSPA